MGKRRETEKGRGKLTGGVDFLRKSDCLIKRPIAINITVKRTLPLPLEKVCD